MLGRGLPRNVETVGFGIDIGVPIRRGQQGDHPLVPGNQHLTDLHRLMRHARCQLHWRIEAEHLLSDRRCATGIGYQRLPLLAVGQQPAHATADRIDGRLESGDQQQPHQSRQLRHRDRPALLGHERRHQIIAGFGRTVFE